MKTKCPYCNYKATDHETLDKRKNPIDKDISFCINCGEVSQYKDNKLIKVSLRSLDKDVRREVNLIRISWLKTRAIKSVKKK